MRLALSTPARPHPAFRLPFTPLELGGTWAHVTALGHRGLPTLVAVAPTFASGRILAPLRPLARQLRLLLLDFERAPDLSALLDAPVLPRRFALLAVSDSCGLAVELALAAPDRVSALVLASPLWPGQSAGLLSRGLRTRGVRVALARWLCGDSLSARSRRALLADVRPAWRSPPLLPRKLARLAPPVRILRGARDPLADDGLSGTALGDPIEYAGHLPFLSRAVAFNGRLAEFLAATERGRPGSGRSCRAGPAFASG